MAHGSSTDVANHWRDRLSGSADRIRQGVAAVKVSPGQLAAAQADVWAAQVAASKPKWAARVGRLTLGDWQNAMATKGVDRIATGAGAAVGKMDAFLAKFLPFVDNAKASLPKRGSYEQNKTRMTQMVDKLHGFKQ